MPVLVAVPVPFLSLLTYDVPHGTTPPVRGARVLVPLGTRQVTGCVVGTVAEVPAGVDLKAVLEVLDDEAFLPGHIIDLALWAAEYYVAGPGETVAAAMPPFAWVESERRLSITDAGRAWLTSRRADTGGAALVLRAMAHGRSVTTRELRTADAAVRGSIDSILRSLLRDGLIMSARALKGKASAFRTVRVVSLTADGQGLAGGATAADGGGEAAVAALGQKQAAALAALRGSPRGLPARVLRERGVGAETVKRLARRGLVSVRDERSERDPFVSVAALAAGALPASGGGAPGARDLTPEQAGAFSRLRTLVAADRFHVALLHGVTGSGKTELYLRMAAEVRAAGRTVLVLVPEIALTPAVAAVFRDVFGDRVAVQHSGLSDGERHDQWHRIRSGAVDIVVGTRSAIFSPLENPGLIVVDEEHDHSYKQEETPRYNARDLAIVRGRQARALVVLGSATPSMESYRHALDGRYELITLQRRVLDRPLAEVRVVNMREVLADEGPEVILSATLVGALERRLARGEQALLLLNRRGFSTSVFCRQCGATLDCPNCSISLTIHRPRQGPPRARCHYCNHSTAVPNACTNCAGPYLEHVGFGTEQVEADGPRLMPAT